MLTQGILPQLGVRIGNVNGEHVELRVADLMGRGEAVAVALVPVFKQHVNGRGETYAFCRLGQARVAVKAEARDIGIDGLNATQSILVVSVPADEPPPHSVRLDPAGRRVLDIRNYRVGIAPSRLWNANDVLGLLLYGGIDNRERIAEEINEALHGNDSDFDADRLEPIVHHRGRALPDITGALDSPRGVERCVVPQSAVTAASRVNTLESRGPATQRLCFALGSCQYTAGMIDATPLVAGATAGPADKSYARLAELLQKGPPSRRPQLLVLTGDQVYVDATAGLFDPAIADGRFRRPYEQFYSSPYVQQIQRQIPICMMLDDHEIENNWEGDDARAFAARRLGRESYVEFQRDVGPLPLPSPNQPTGYDQGLWCAVTLFGFEFFFADTRTERQRRTAADYASRHLLGEVQWKALMQWLRKPSEDGRPRFVVSPSILIPRRLATLEDPATALLSDAWDGYPASQHRLFDEFAEHDISDVIFLSGDEHLSCTAEATCRSLPSPGKRPTIVRSLHCSGLYAPYPFANSIPEDFARSEHGARLGKHRWDVTSHFHEGQGFAVIAVEPKENAWQVEITFMLDTGSESERFYLPKP
jgi:hypothetical protein